MLIEFMKGGINVVFSNAVYDKLKWVAQILLPALATLYFALSKVWNLPYTEQIVGTISAVDVFLGAILQLSTKIYNDDQRVLNNKEG